jgi:hypothetical protein
MAEKLPTWGDQLSEDLKTSQEVVDFVATNGQTPSDIVRSAMKYNKELGEMKASVEDLKGKEAELEALKAQVSGMIKVPGEESTPEEIAAYQKAIGVPDTIDGYGLLDDMDDKEKGKMLLENFKAQGFSKDTAKKIIGMTLEMDKSIKEMNEKAKNAAIQEYRKSLGDDAEPTFRAAETAVNLFYPGDEFSDLRQEIMNRPELIKGLVEPGKKSLENPRLFSPSMKGVRADGYEYPEMAKQGRF